MIISEPKSREGRMSRAEMLPRTGDVLDMLKFNSLPSPVTARMCGGGDYWIETLDAQTGCMRLDVCGQIDFSHFSSVMVLIDIDGNEYDPDDFWIE